VTIRAIGGATSRFGSQHSATGESWYMALPGLYVVTAGTPDGAYALLRQAIRANDPVLFIEHKALYGRKGPVERGERVLPDFGRAAVLRAGADVTFVATLLMVDRALAAAETLAEEGIEAEVIDLRWLNPLDIATVEQSVGRTGRLVIAEEQPHAAGWGATVISELAMRGTTFAAPPRALSLPADMPIPFSPPLEDAVIPSGGTMVAAARELVRA
jgi:acetoin:2,6-dichlorophenolindophenol oxidoreductase subunit beta